jgi:hypothetical protein
MQHQVAVSELARSQQQEMAAMQARHQQEQQIQALGQPFSGAGQSSMQSFQSLLAGSSANSSDPMMLALGETQTQALAQAQAHASADEVRHQANTQMRQLAEQEQRRQEEEHRRDVAMTLANIAGQAGLSLGDVQNLARSDAFLGTSSSSMLMPGMTPSTSALAAAAAAAVPGNVRAAVAATLEDRWSLEQAEAEVKLAHHEHDIRRSDPSSGLHEVQEARQALERKRYNLRQRMQQAKESEVVARSLGVSPAELASQHQRTRQMQRLGLVTSAPMVTQAQLRRSTRAATRPAPEPFNSQEMEQRAAQQAVIAARQPASRTSSRGSKSPRNSRSPSVQSLSSSGRGTPSMAARRRMASGKGDARLAAKGDRMLQQQRQREQLAAQAETATRQRMARAQGGKAPRSEAQAQAQQMQPPRSNRPAHGGKAPRTAGGKAPRTGGKAPRVGASGKAPRSGGKSPALAHLRTISAPPQPGASSQRQGFGRTLSADAATEEKKQYPRKCPNPECDKVFSSSAGYVFVSREMQADSKQNERVDGVGTCGCGGNMPRVGAAVLAYFLVPTCLSSFSLCSPRRFVSASHRLASTTISARCTTPIRTRR